MGVLADRFVDVKGAAVENNSYRRGIHSIIRHRDCEAPHDHRYLMTMGHAYVYRTQAFLSAAAGSAC